MLQINAKSVLTAATFSLLLAFSAIAQNAPIDPQRLAQARELLELSGGARNFDTVMPSMMQQMTQILTAQKPENRAQIEQVMQSMMTKFTDRKQELIDQIAVIYAERFTSDDIAGLIAFYKSPTGRKFTATQPEILKDSMAAGQSWGRKIGAEIESSARQELKKRGIDL